MRIISRESLDKIAIIQNIIAEEDDSRKPTKGYREALGYFANQLKYITKRTTWGTVDELHDNLWRLAAPELNAFFSRNYLDIATFIEIYLGLLDLYTAQDLPPFLLELFPWD